MDKYGLSLLLVCTATLMFDIIGLTFFVLFFFHALAYFVFRSKLDLLKFHSAR
jgi:hypothetical protein